MFRVAVVGRPNVGKSTLFNRLTRSRKAMVGDTPGITRDRIVGLADWEGKCFEVIDTGGIILDPRETIARQTLRQAHFALEQAQLILLVVDGRTGVTPLDEQLHTFLRRTGRRFLLVVNKIDLPRLEQEAAAFYRLGVETLFAVSAEHNLGMRDLLEAILETVPESDREPLRDQIRVAITGRPNVGKSSILNRFLGQERAIVSPQPGTTRDSVDTALVHGRQRYLLVDTAGIRRKIRSGGPVEQLSVLMARKSLARADVVLLVVDAGEGVTRTDATIGGYAHDAGKSLIIVANKWDLVEKDPYTAIEREKEFRTEMRFLDYCPLLFTSAESGQRIFKLLEVVKAAHEARYRRVATSELNRFMETVLARRIEASGSSRKSSLLYISQVAVAPPTFVLFTRSRRKIHFSLERFIRNRLREEFGFFATPIRLIQRTRQKRK